MRIAHDIHAGDQIGKYNRILKSTVDNCAYLTTTKLCLIQCNVCFLKCREWDSGKWDKQTQHMMLALMSAPRLCHSTATVTNKPENWYSIIYPGLKWCIRFTTQYLMFRIAQSVLFSFCNIMCRDDPCHCFNNTFVGRAQYSTVGTRRWGLLVKSVILLQSKFDIDKWLQGTKLNF